MADFLSEEEQAQRVQKLVKDYGFIIVGSVLAAIACVIGWSWFQDYRVEVAQERVNLFEEFIIDRALEADLNERLEELKNDNAQSIYVVYALMLKAKDAVDEQQYESAQTLLEEAQSIVRDETVKSGINVRLARIQFQLDEFDAALATLEEVGKGYESYVLELKGDIYRATEEYALAEEAYRTALDMIPTPSSENFQPQEQIRMELKMALMPRTDSPSTPEEETEQ